jgi:septal ring-binding cell division protein DamX
MLEIEKKRVSNSDINDIALKIKEFEERLNNKEVKLTKDETKDLKKDIANLKKEQKNAVKDKDTPKDVIDFINSCFTKKTERPPATRKTVKKAKAAVAADDTDAGADDTGADEDGEADAVAEGTKVAIKVADPKAKTKATKVTAKATTIPKSKKSPAVKPVKECPDGKILNPTTNRCVKMKVVARDDKYSF